MAHWEYGVLYERNHDYIAPGPSKGEVSFGEDLEQAIGLAKQWLDSGHYKEVGLYRRAVGDWEGFCIKTALAERAARN